MLFLRRCLRGGKRLFKERKQIVALFRIVGKNAVRACVKAEVPFAVPFGNRFRLLHKGAYVRPSVSVETAAEFIDHCRVRLPVHVRIPHQLGADIGAQLLKLSAEGVEIPLVEDADHVVRGVIGDMVVKNGVIGKNGLVEGKIHMVVPNGEVTANLCPVLKEFGKAIVLRTGLIVDPMIVAGIHDAELYQYVIFKCHSLRGRDRVAVSQRFDQNIGEFRLDLAGNPVDKGEQRAALRAVPGVQRRALLAVATQLMLVGVVLRNRDDASGSSSSHLRTLPRTVR